MLLHLSSDRHLACFCLLTVLKNAAMNIRVFILPDGRYVSELTPSEKNKISHRAEACRLMKIELDKIRG